MTISEAANKEQWDAFLAGQTYAPFLQSWTMGEVYQSLGQEIVRLEMREGNELIGICFGHVVPAKRGRHLAVPYGPLLKSDAPMAFLEELKRVAKDAGCTFIRMSPFLPAEASAKTGWPSAEMRPSPLHLLAEHVWYLPLVESDPWTSLTSDPSTTLKVTSEEKILMSMRKTTRYLIRQAEKLGVEVVACDDPVRDLPVFLSLHEKTRRRHSFTPYTDAFFRAQVARFAPRGECTLYLARHEGEVLAASIHMHAFGETSYHHGASRDTKIPASYLLQWQAIRDALKRGDRIYNFWGVAPPELKTHPFAGVTTFKTGFGGNLLELVHCMDIPLSMNYRITRAFEQLRKWRRGF